VKVDTPAPLICGVAWRELAEGYDIQHLVALPHFLVVDKEIMKTAKKLWAVGIL
jgi:hypothetical protein